MNSTRALMAAIIIVAIYGLWFWYGSGRDFLDFFAHLRKRGWSWPLAAGALALASAFAGLVAVVLTRVFGGPTQAW